jgi:uncharacterized membrane protein YphA (DoxX/SURF4 family)
MKTQRTSSLAETTLSPWRWKGIAGLRIVFGLVWAIDAWFKWQPDFIHKFTDYLSGALDGQPPAVAAWINFWINVVKVDPHFFAYAVAIGETAVALGLIFGALSNLTNIGGILLSVVIWATAEGFGGPYTPGSTDIGAAIIYVLVFVGLFLANAGMYYGVDQWLTDKLGALSFLASARGKHHEDHRQHVIQPGHAL